MSGSEGAVPRRESHYDNVNNNTDTNNDDENDEVFLRDPEPGPDPETVARPTAVAAVAVPVLSPCPELKECVINCNGEHVATGTAARKILIDERTEMRLRPITVKHELLSLARPANDNSLDDVRRCVAENGGVRIDLDEEMEVVLELGDLDAVCPGLDLEVLLRYQCVSRPARLTVVGKLLFGSGEHQLLVVIYSGGDRCYVYSLESDVLYIASDHGLDQLLLKHGHRNVHEMYDMRPDEDDDGSGVPVVMVPLAMCINIYEVRSFVRQKVCLSTFRYDHRPRLAGFGKSGGYFMVGDEEGLGLAQFFPGRLFTCLRDAGYYVIGRGEMGLIVLCNVLLEVFVLLDKARVLKVANTISGFLRDRMRTNIQPYRRSFRPGELDLALMCVGQMRDFRCDVAYALPCADEFYHWLATVDGGPFMLEECTPTVVDRAHDDRGLGGL